MGHVQKNEWDAIRYQGDEFSVVTEEIAEEFALTIMLNGTEFATIVCSPFEIEELIIGFLAAEGIIRFYDEIKSISIDEKLGFAYVETFKEIDGTQTDHSKRFIGSCCGKSRQFYFKNDAKTAKTVMSSTTVKAGRCLALMKELHNRSEHFLKTGGVHNAALADSNQLLSMHTDIGRHNALDKLYGHILKNKLSVRDKIIVFSGRISSEVLLKVSKIGIGILISKSAPTNLALEFANELGITAIGFVRGDKMNIYTHPHRVIETNQLVDEQSIEQV